MKLRFLKYMVFFLVFITTQDLSNAQTPQEDYLNSEIQQKTVDKENWQAIIEGIDYSDQEKEEEEEEDDPAASTNQNSSSRSYSSSSGSGGGSEAWAGFFKFLFWVLIIAALVLLINYLMGGGSFFKPSSKKLVRNNSNFSIENIEDHIYESDLDRFIREAVEDENYALAIRLYYLAIIKELSLSQVIRWKKDKTNKDYLSEMRRTSMFKAFREVTRIFERVWYGKAKLEHEEYLDIKPKFEALVKSAQLRQVVVDKEQ